MALSASSSSSAAVARAAAIVIALAGAIDPAMTRERTVPVRLAVVQPAESDFVSSAQGQLDGFEVEAGPATPDHRAVIVVSDGHTPLPALPESARAFVLRSDAAPQLRIDQFTIPATAIANRTMTASARIATTSDEPITASLYAADRLVAREALEPDAAAGPYNIDLPFVATGDGLISLRLDVTQGEHLASATTAVRIITRPLRVQFEDARPSWQSTFVRRALEDDAAFEVTADIATSRGVTATAGQPIELADTTSRERVDVVVVGSPSAATSADVARLERFARERGGTILLLADEDARAALSRFTGSSTSSWTRRTLSEPALVTGPAGTLRVSDTLVFDDTTPAATPLASTTAGCIVVEFPMGRGRIIVSGALDAWKFRQQDDEAFGAFWRTVIGDAAAAAPPALTVNAAPATLRPGDTAEVEVVSRAPRNADGVTVAARAWLEAGDTRTPIPLWPSPRAGVFNGRVTVPDVAGTPRIVAEVPSAAPLQAEAPLAIGADYTSVSPALSDDDLRAFASAHGGAYIASGDIDALRRALEAAFPSNTMPVDVRPMRSPWWIVPFALCLGVEWHWRRQRGLK